MDKTIFIAQAAKLLPAYKPNFEVRQQLALVDLIAVVGPTGVGKTSIIEGAGLPFVITDVTREPREGEVEGKDFNFRKDYDALLQEIKVGKFVQFVLQRGTDFYGSKASSYPQQGTCTMPIIARVVVEFRKYGFRKVVPVYILPPNFEEWMRRIGQHHDADLAARLLEARESLQSALADNSYIFLVNDNLQETIASFKRIAGEGYSMPPDQQPAIAIAKELLRQLSEQLSGTVTPEA